MTDLLDGEWRRPARALLTIRRVEVVVFLALPFLVAAVALSVVSGVTEAIAVAVAGLVTTGLSLVGVERRWQAWGYAERQEDLLVRRGVLVRRTSVVPYGRMQYVDVTAGPLDRRLGLARVTLHTAAAASDASIPGLPAEEATRLRDRLAALGEARAAGL
ncbi:MAG: PH domain-containing protein [Frankiaceae bacterium]|nr:PH domain-containing protein [Frankiaceae bacterium]